MSVDVVHARNRLAGDGQSGHSVRPGRNVVQTRPGLTVKQALEIRYYGQDGRSLGLRDESSRVESTRPMLGRLCPMLS